MDLLKYNLVDLFLILNQNKFNCFEKINPFYPFLILVIFKNFKKQMKFISYYFYDDLMRDLKMHHKNYYWLRLKIKDFFA